jgi:uncharacterized protein (DUF58 family)
MSPLKQGAPSADELLELLASVRRIHFKSNRLVEGVLAGSYASMFRGTGVEFEEVREYVEGDDPRAVDWNVTARIGRPYVKTYIEERDLPVLFLLDLSASMDGGFAAGSARHTAASLCACLGLSAIKNNDRIGWIAFSDVVEHYAPLRAGSFHAMQLVRDCLALRAAHRGTRLQPALQLASRMLRRRGIVFVLSDFLTDGWQRPLSLCARRHDVIACQLLVPELQSPAASLQRVRDPESGRSDLVDWHATATRLEYDRRILNWRAEVAAQLRQAGVDHLPVEVSRAPGRDHVARALLQFFQARAARRVRR